MDGHLEHSDSDSGESWTLLEPSPALADEVPEFPENIPSDRYNLSNEKDEDTDGISIISDSDPESPLSNEFSDNKPITKPVTEEERENIGSFEYVSFTPPPIDDSMTSEDNILCDNSGKHKIYVHKRNKRLSMVLNILVLGSVITAAGVAIGHMWGAKNECTINSIPSVNKILSNLYKLQEENAYLRSKLKEITLLHNANFQQKKSGTVNISSKQTNCKRVFEESLSKKIADKPIKCLDNESEAKILSINLIESGNDKNFLGQFDKVKDVYKESKNWLGEEVLMKFNDEENNINKNNILHSERPLIQKDDNKQLKGGFPNGDLHLPYLAHTDSTSKNSNPKKPEKPLSEKKVTYADSLKSEVKTKIVQKRDIYMNTHNKTTNKYYKNKINKDLDDSLVHSASSENELNKDDRYTGLKKKKDRKNHDKQKKQKKQKRKNKYEQWEMKGGYLKDFDEFSIISSQDNEYLSKNPDMKILGKDFEPEIKVDEITIESNLKDFEKKETTTKYSKKLKGKENNKNKDLTWFEKRARLRNEARKKLESELFSETSPNDANWYFRRMQRREQCRSKGDNSTYKKLAKRNLNFKTKH